MASLGCYFLGRGHVGEKRVVVRGAFGGRTGARLSLRCRLGGDRLSFGARGEASEPFFQRGGTEQAAGNARQHQREIVGGVVEHGEVGGFGGALIERCGEFAAVVDD